MRIKEALRSAARLALLDPKSLAIVRWKLQRGDSTLRVRYDLDASSVVLDVGGYRGDWAEEIVTRYGCALHVFEPVPAFCELVRRRVGGRPGVIVNQAGLGAHHERCRISVDEEASSVEKRGASEIEIELLDVVDYFERHGLARVHLMKINIEGGEYPLLERMHEAGLLRRCRDLQIQFHDFVPDAERRRDALRAVLAGTHELTWDYPFIWENWRLKGER